MDDAAALVERLRKAMEKSQGERMKEEPVKGEIIQGELVGETALARSVPGELRVAREPQLVLDEARKAAAALMDVVEKKKKKVVLNGKTYLEFEDWQTVARFYGVSVKVADTRYTELSGARGFEARAEVVLVSNGLVISAADAMCLDDEENWGKRPKYEWQDKLDEKGNKIWKFNKEKGKSLPERERILVGEESVPLFQLRSMAQTRACAKALRNVLAFVPVLAGYAPTPVEEMSGVVSLNEAVEEGKRQAEEEARYKEREAEQLRKEAIAKEQPPKTPINTPPPAAAKASRQAKEIKEAIRDKTERDPAIVTISGMIEKVEEGVAKTGNPFRRVTLSVPGGKRVVMSAFDNREFPDGSKFFTLLELGGGMHASFVIKTKGKYIDIIRPVKISKLEFDLDGIPIIQRNEGYEPTREPGDELPEEYQL